MFKIKVAAALYNDHGIRDMKLADYIASTNTSPYETDYHASILVKNYLNDLAQQSFREAA